MRMLAQKRRTKMRLGLKIGQLDKLRQRLRNRLGHMPKPVTIKITEIELLNKAMRAVLKKQSTLIEIEPPVKIVGDTHGQFYDLLRLFDFCGNPSKMPYVFLGDYVDRGQFSLESLCLLFSLKIKYPQTFWLLRGNHECSQTSYVYGFYDECRLRFGIRRGDTIWKDFCNTFNYLPLAAVVGRRILCVHGGLSPDLHSLDQIRQIPIPSEISDYGLICDLVWSDPDMTLRDGWGENSRGASFTFGKKQIKEACESLGIDLIVRGHQMVPKGFKFTAGGRVLTIFSSPNYGSMNSAGILKIDENLVCSIEILKPDPTMELVYSADEKVPKTKKKQENRLDNT